MYGVDISKHLDMTSHEVVLAERIDGVVEMLSRVVNAQPGSHYQWDKAQELARKAQSLADLLSSTAPDADGFHRYEPLGNDVRPDVVRSAVAVWGQGHDAGRRLWPMTTAEDIPDGVREQLAAGYAENEAFKAALDTGDMDTVNRIQAGWKTQQ